jgi:hypothetical protein
MTAIGGLGPRASVSNPELFVPRRSSRCIVVFIELWVIAWIPEPLHGDAFLRAALQVVVAGALVFAVGPSDRQAL